MAKVPWQGVADVPVKVTVEEGNIKRKEGEDD